MTDHSGNEAQAANAQSAACASSVACDPRAFAIEAARAATDRHCTDVRVFDVRDRSHVCDYVVVASGTSDRQVRSVGAEIGDIGESVGMTRFRSNADPASTWLVVDFVDVVVHLFEPSRRAYYDLDELWAGVPEVNFDRPAQA